MEQTFTSGMSRLAAIFDRLLKTPPASRASSRPSSTPRRIADDFERSFVKAERDRLLGLVRRLYQEIDNVYDVDQPAGEAAKEYPFSGAGQLLIELRDVLRDCGVSV